MVADRIELPRRQARIDEHRPGIEPVRGEGEHQRRRAVFVDDQHPIAGADAEGRGARRGGVDGTRERAVAERPPALHEGRCIAESTRAARRELVDPARSRRERVGQAAIATRRLQGA